MVCTLPVAFADRTPLDRDDLEAAPVRYPSPRRLTAPLKLDGAKATQGAAALGLRTIGDLLEHVPRDRRDARAITGLAPEETATIVVEVRRIRARPVRRRGMRPLVEATVADHSGTVRVTFFQQPWLVDRYPPGTRLILHGRFDPRRGLTVQGHARDDRAAERRRQRDRGVALPGHRRALLDADPGARPTARTRP